jgi:hypothetical protein
MYIRLTGWGFLRLTRFGCSWSTISNRCLGWTDLTPSIPAVFFPRLSCVTRRTAISRADLDFIKSFWSLWTALTLPRCSARKMRFCIRYTCCSNLRQGSVRQLSLSGARGCLLLGAFVFVILLVPLSSIWSCLRQRIQRLSRWRWLLRQSCSQGLAVWTPAHRIDHQ